MDCCVKGDCTTGKVEYRYQSGDYYEGEFVNNKPNGRGVCYFSNGDVYTGQFQDGLRHGKGTLIQFDGNKVESMWKNDRSIRKNDSE